MPLFFFLAGCFLKSESLKAVLYKRIRTLLIPFLFFYILALLVKLGKALLVQPTVSTWLTFNYSIGNVNQTLWFIPTLFIAILAYNILIASALNRYRGG